MDYVSVPTRAAGVAPVATSNVSAQSSALTAGDWVCIVSAITYVIRGSNPTATTSCYPLSPNVTNILRDIQEGDKLAFILGSGTGTASLHPAP